MQPATFMTESFIHKVKLVLQRCEQFETRGIYELLLEEEFNIEADFKFNVEIVNEQLNFDNAVKLLKCKLLPVKVRNSIWKFFHNVIYDELWKGKLKNSLPVCKLCNESDIDKKHMYFSCPSYKSFGRDFMNVLRVISHYNQEDVLALRFWDDDMKSTWFVAHYLHYMIQHRENCSVKKFHHYLETERKTLERTRYCDEKLEMELSEIINQLCSTGYQ